MIINDFSALIILTHDISDKIFSQNGKIWRELDIYGKFLNYEWDDTFIKEESMLSPSLVQKLITNDIITNK
jgi:hypothetical protein